jgi:iron complex outermembrane recepter protein
MMRFPSVRSLCAALLCIACASNSTAVDEANHDLDPVIVTSTRRPADRDNVPGAVSVIDMDDIQRGRPTVTLDEALISTPGVVVQNRHNFAQDLRLSIRGFGARAAFGIRGVKLVVDGIPQTLADGQSQVDSLDLGAIERIEVLRGVAAALYGNAAGGVVSLTTESGDRPPFVELRPTFGSHGLRKHQAKLGGASGSSDYLLNISRTKLDGFRQHSETESWLLTGKARHDLGEDAELTTLVSFVDSPTAMDPGALDADAVAADRTRAHARNVLLDAGESVRQGRLGARYQRAMGADAAFTADAYGLFRYFEQRLPIDRAVGYDRFSAGGGARYDDEGEAAGVGLRSTVGVDIQLQDDDRRNFDNPEGARGETLLLRQTERVTAAGVYASQEADLARDVTLTVGGRYDHLRFRALDHLHSNGDDSGERDFDAVSPSIGLLWRAAGALRVYGSVATAYETPTTTELVNRPTGAGGFNEDLDPQQALSKEVGARGMAGDWRYDIAAYSIDVNDKLIPFEVASAPGRQFFRNAGSATHRGVETSIVGLLGRAWRVSATYTYSDFRFDEFRVEDSVYDGNRIPGIPTQQGYAAARYTRGLVFASIEANCAGSYFVDDANTVENNAYCIVNLRASADLSALGRDIAPFVGITNLANRLYNGAVRVNAFGGRYFEPAPGRSIYVGLTVGQGM